MFARGEDILHPIFLSMIILNIIKVEHGNVGVLMDVYKLLFNVSGSIISQHKIECHFFKLKDALSHLADYGSTLNHQYAHQSFDPIPTP